MTEVRTEWRINVSPMSRTLTHRRVTPQEQVIEVTFDDRPVKPASKLDAHLNRLGPVLHRAFSVFLFDSRGR
jgi:hypothetical protein